MTNLVDFLSTHILGTPDFGHSDIWHFNFALKFHLSQALKSGYLPFWSKDIGTGFPLLGEGQIGMFNLYNLFAFKFLDPIIAFNLGFFVIVLTTATGSYLFSRIIKLNKLASLFVAVIFSLSGVFITQAVHYNLIQAASFLPWEFFLAEKFLQDNKKRWLIALAIVLQQQIFSGFQQLTMISLVSLFIYLLIRIKQTKKLGELFFILGAIILGIIISLPQLLPTWQLTLHSFRTDGVSIQSLTNIPFMPVNLLSFLNPYYFGDPRIGTYPVFSDNWGIFWESTGYIGLLPLFLVTWGFINNRKQKIFIPLFIIATSSLILLLGKSTPFFFLFQLPPLSMFRVPARFLFPFVWAIVLLAGITLSKIPQKIAVLVIFLSILDLGYFGVNYNAAINTQTWLKTPESVTVLKNDPAWYRIYTINPYSDWNTRFLSSDPKDKLLRAGWRNMDPYFAFRNSLDPNQNLYWDLPSINYYSGIGFKRLELWQNILSQGIISDPINRYTKISSSSAKLLSLAGAKYLISPYKIRDSELVANTSGEPIFYIFKNSLSRPHAYFSNEFVVANNIADLQEKTINPNSMATVLEEQVNIDKSLDQTSRVTIVKDTDLEVTIETSSQSQNLLILSDSYFPGWKATIDKTVTRILPANINQRALVVSPGVHLVTFKYEPFTDHLSFLLLD